MRVFFDTHILIYWCLDENLLSKAQALAIRSIHEENPAIVADITLWEISMLHLRGSLELSIPFDTWLARAVAAPFVRTAEITPRIAAEVASIGGWVNQDPADRLIVATARVFGATLLTNDRSIRESNLVPVI